jgi:hypothetical protein
VGKVLKAVGIGLLIIGVALIPGAPAFLGIAKGALLAAGITATLSGLATVAFAPKMPRSQLGRLNVSLDPSTPRKTVVGTTAMPLDLRYHESSGSDQEYIDYIIVTAAHKVKSITEIWFEDKQAWTSSGGVTARYSGYLTIATVLEGTSANTISINGGFIWGATRRLTGCAYVHLRVKRTGNTKKAESPLVQGLPSRVTIKGEGAPLYDPRKDSTVTGGSGSHRANDQTTWGSYTDPDDCDNPALQLLFHLLGWKINGVLSVGCGVPSTRIDLESFITAANICDENVALAGGGTQKRYRTSGTYSDSDDRMEIINVFLASMNGTLRDNGGKLTVTVMKNDLANYVLTFDDSDVLDEFEWNQTRGLNDSYNVARGRYVDPSDNSLYQLVDYPEIRITSPDGIERVMTVDLPYVEDGKRAQRIAKQVLQRNQYRGMFSATFTAKAMGCAVGDVVRLTFTPLGWTNKLFRVISQQINFNGQVPLVLVEENAAIYAWDAEEEAPVTPTAPTVYDPLNNPLILGIADAEAIADGKITSFYQASAPTAEGIGDIWIDTDDANKLYRWDGSSWVLSRDTGITQAISDAATAQATADGKIVTFYQTTAPTAEAIGDLWVDTDDSNKMYRWSGSAWVSVRDAGIAQAIAAAATAQATADGKIDSYYQASMPSGTVGDLWIDTDDGNKLYRHNGTTFVEVQDDGIAQAISDAAGAQATADGKVTTFYSTSTPTAEAIGDLWYNSSTLILKRWSGSAWVDTATNGAPSGTTVAGRDASTVASTIKSDGVINTNKVETASVTSNAITTSGGNFLFLATCTAGATTTVTSQTITTSGGPVIVMFSCAEMIGPASLVAFYLYIDGTLEQTFPGPGTLSVWPASFIYYDAPSAGSHTYEVKVSNADVYDATAYSNSMAVLELKR